MGYLASGVCPSSLLVVLDVYACTFSTLAFSAAKWRFKHSFVSLQVGNAARTNMSYQIRTMPLLMIRTVEAIHQHVSQIVVIPQKNADDIHVELVNDLRDLSEHYLIRS